MFSSLINNYQWSNFLKKNKHGPDLIAFIEELYKPYKVNPDKCLANLFHLSDKYYEDYIDLKTPSVFAIDSLNIPKGFDIKFVAGFPDVFLWVSKPDNFYKLKSREEFNDLYREDDTWESRFIANGKLTNSLMRRLVNFYVNAVNPTLETTGLL